MKTDGEMTCPFNSGRGCDIHCEMYDEEWGCSIDRAAYSIMRIADALDKIAGGGNG